MKISEIISESEGTIKTYWLLKSVNIDEYVSTYERLLNIETVNAEQEMIVRSEMLRLFSFIDTLLRNEDWQYLEDDEDFEKVYSSLLRLHQNLQSQLNNGKR